MGYDLIESGDFFPQSRLKGNFANDSDYGEFLGIGKGKRRAKGEAEKIEEQFPDLTEKATCPQVQNRIIELQAEMDLQRGKITAGDKSKWYRKSLGILESKLSQAKLILQKLKCEELAEQELLKEQQANILSTISTSTTGSAKVGKASGTIAGMNKYLVYGIGGVFVLGAIFILLKPSN
jgi:hypothetical protein